MSVDDFVTELSAHAERAPLPALIPIIEGLRRPIAVRTMGRPGVGRRTVTAALCAAGVPVVDARPDVDVLVVAETAKPEDCRTVAEATRPVLTVLNKADLLGTSAADLAARVSRRTGAPTVPVSALLAVAAPDAAQISALRVLTVDPADLSSTDAFCAGRHTLDAGIRAGLLAALDLSGIAELTAALRSGEDGPALTALLRRLSNIDQVCSGLDTVTAALRYRRLRRALTSARTLAARTGDERLAAVLAGDAAVLAAMSAATEVLEADGLDMRSGEESGQRAVRWQRYSRGPVNVLHRQCGADVARGALRLLSDVGAGDRA